MTGRAELLDVALEAAREAARVVVEDRPAALSVTGTKTSSTDIVTEMDRRSEQVIVDLLHARRPDDGVLGEEGSATDGTSGVTWVVDPIDGTVNYLYGLPSFAVSIAAREGDEVVVGAVVNPVTGQEWTAVRGEGALLDGRRVRVNPAPDLPMALVATGFGYEPERRERQADVLRALLPRVRDVRRAGAASLDLCAVATGLVDAYYEQSLKPWDLAAGGLVAEEAGARVGGLRGRPAGPDLVVAAPPGLYEPLTALLEELDADVVPEGL